MCSLNGGVLPEDLVSPRKLYDDLDRAAHGREHDLPVHRRELAIKREDGSEAGRVENARSGEVQDKVACAGLDVLLVGRLELGRIAEVKGTPYANDREVRRGGLDREAHFEKGVVGKKADVYFGRASRKRISYHEVNAIKRSRIAQPVG